MNCKRLIPVTIILACLLGCSSPQRDTNAKAGFAADGKQDASLKPGLHLARGKNYMISTQGKAATEAAYEILSKGGNLVDAAVAASFTISVERPQSTGLGGGGFFLYRDGKSKKIYAIDFRERAPRKAHKKMFLDSKGEVIKDLSTVGAKAVAVPGLVKGLFEVHKRFGRLKMEDLLAPAIRLAEEGFETYPILVKALNESQEDLLKFEESAKIFTKPTPYVIGDRITQKDLAQTLRILANDGPAPFYSGKIGQELVRTIQKYGGILTLEDLKSYRVHWRNPLRSTYKGHDIVSMPPPSSGGTHVLQILGMLEADDLQRFGKLSVRSTHLLTQAMQQAFADRAQYMGDSDFVKVPLDRLLSRKYLRTQRSQFNDLPQELRSVPSIQIKPGLEDNEHTETTHISMMDDQGNVIATSQTINGWFGSSIVGGNTGIVLNNEMDDFSAKVGSSNMFGAVGSRANEVAPTKTPLSSMSPTFVLRNGSPVMALGAPGGTRIISCVAQTILNYFEFKQSLYDSVSSPRIHHQWSPDVLKIDAPGLPPATTDQLIRMGYKVETKADAVPCRVMAVAREQNELVGVSDPRDAGTAKGR